MLWLSDYLDNRMQQVMLKDKTSAFRKINAGVPQGSVLGPLLFLIYINDIADNLQSLTRLFADDTSLGYSSSNIFELEDVMNRDLIKLNDWSEKWLTNFNPNKTELLFISNTVNSDMLRVNFRGVPLNPVLTHRHLGVTLSSDGKWYHHIDNIRNSCMKKVAALRKFKYILSVCFDTYFSVSKQPHR